MSNNISPAESDCVNLNVLSERPNHWESAQRRSKNHTSIKRKKNIKKKNQVPFMIFLKQEMLSPFKMASYESGEMSRKCDASFIVQRQGIKIWIK